MFQMLTYTEFATLNDTVLDMPVTAQYDHLYDKERREEALAWYNFRKKYHLGRRDDLMRWHDLYLRLCAEGLL